MDNLSNRLSQISNGYFSGRNEVQVKLPHTFTQRFNIKKSNSKYISILEILRAEGYIRGFFISKIQKDKNFVRNATVFLKYDARGKPAVRRIFRVTKSGNVANLNTRSLWQPLSTSGCFVISTSRGLLTDRDARINNLGGTILFGVYLFFRYLIKI